MKIEIKLDLGKQRLIRSYVTVLSAGRGEFILDVTTNTEVEELNLSLNGETIIMTGSGTRWQSVINDNLLINTSTHDFTITATRQGDVYNLGVLRLYTIVSDLTLPNIKTHYSDIQDVTSLTNVHHLTMSTSLAQAAKQILPLGIMTQDINNNHFIIDFVNADGEKVNLSEEYQVEILTAFTRTGITALTPAHVYDGVATWEFDTSRINQGEVVHNFVYIKKVDGELLISADANAFTFSVGVSEKDRQTIKNAESYDYNYEKILREFEVKLDGSIESVKDDVRQIANDTLSDIAGDLRQEMDALQIETTNKDIISSAEIIAARGGKPTLGVRLDETTARLAQKAQQTALEVEKERINNLIALPDGSTTNDARLEDIAIGYDGTVYDSPGEAVRQQFGAYMTEENESWVV